MEAVHPVNRSGSNEKDTNWNGPFAPRHRAASERDPICNGLTKALEENRSSSTLPKSFHTMLKTTTETGDIGIFSIKPSRIPQSLSRPRNNNLLCAENIQNSPHVFQPYGIPIVDDRRRLPSYARDATLEAIAMYESPRRRPDNRSPRDSDYRSYSLTQTSSYPPHTLSNHRSFTSLRSQQEGSGLLQRPRSPFAYPTRLRRPGFRPSSPALTDGGLIDYSRRAEIERPPNGPGNSTHSPASLYAQKRKPLRHLSLRSEANRSTPLLRQQSPPRHSSSPNLLQITAYQGAEWARMPYPSCGNTSPSRSTYSLASTVNLLATAAPASTTTTPGKVHPPSPLYYDYTEDFDIDDHHPLEPPPIFRIDQSIPEDGPLCSDIRAVATTECRTPAAIRALVLDNSSSSAAIFQGSFEGSSTSSNAIQEIKGSAPVLFNEVTRLPEGELGVELVNGKYDTNAIQLSGLSHSARELSTHVEEILGLHSSSSSEIQTSGDGQHLHHRQVRANEGNSIYRSKGLDQASARSSICSLKTHLQQFPRPPSRRNSMSTNPAGMDQKDLTAEKFGNRVSNDCSHTLQCSAGSQKYDEIDGNENYPPARLISHEKKRASLFNSLDTGLAELDEMITQSFGSTHAPNNLRRARANILPLKLPIEQQTFSPQAVTRPRPRVRYIENQNEGITAQNPTQTQSYQGDWQEVSPLERRELDLGSLPNFSHQISNRLVSRPESPMLAPKPISPARQLRLKNSIPQIMKALPPLPSDSPTIVALSPRKLSMEPTLSRRISPPLAEALSYPPREPQKEPQIPSSKEEDVKEKLASLQDRHVPPVEKEPAVTEVRTPHWVDPATPLVALPRLKLKSRYSSNLPLSPPSAQPWNMEESYPWSSGSSSVKLQPLTSPEDYSASPLPKFKLKVTRASNSNQGTILVNRESIDSRGLGGLNLRMPKDLFTPPSGFDNIMRQVGKHFYTRTSDSVHKSETDSASVSAPCQREAALSAVKDKDAIRPKSRTKSENSSSPGDARSTFSDDSSHVGSRSRLRTRLSNLRARMPFQYVYKSAVHSSDDTICKRRSEETHLPSLLRSAPNIHSARAIVNGSSQRRVFGKTRGRKLRVKVRGWLSHARSAITGQRRSRSSTGRKSDDDTTQLPPM